MIPLSCTQISSSSSYNTTSKMKKDKVGLVGREDKLKFQIEYTHHLLYNLVSVIGFLLGPSVEHYFHLYISIATEIQPMNPGDFVFFMKLARTWSIFPKY